ncbi:hypothetical protein [Acidiphilium acidophilum]|uniref:hypothetical protein n=1 Tax=Acidiphilium acidophilum TaxID=76588 RepID=UPI002E8E6907|nr:hypothetical protein [Acidiphilium acidophilum]
MTGDPDTAGRRQRKPGAGHRGKGTGCGPANGPGNGNPGKPLDTSPDKQRARINKRWAAHRERVAQGPDAVAQHARMIRLEKARLELVRAKRAMRASNYRRARVLQGANDADA